MYYLNTEVCVQPAFETELKAHPDWWLRDDYGNVLTHGVNGLILDPTVPEAREWWMSIPFVGLTNTSDQAYLIDGILADGVEWRPGVLGPNISESRYTTIYQAKMTMVEEMQKRFTAMNGGTPSVAKKSALTRCCMTYRAAPSAERFTP